MPQPPTAPPVIAPLPEQNRQDALGVRTRQEAARFVVEGHKTALSARRERDLLSEKLLLHIDGSGDFQWADIYDGQRIVIPRAVSEFRKSENVLRPVVDNAVAYHTTMPLRYAAESTPDRRARDRALVDTLWMNYVAEDQDLNGLFADALYMAMPAGFCPVHVYWREDPNDGYEPMAPPAEGQPAIASPKPGLIDCWLGNPFDTVFDSGAKRGSWRWWSYGRVLPAQMVRDAFAHIPEAAKLEGTTKIPSAALFQRIALAWKLTELGVHGSAVLNQRTQKESKEELILLLCRETLPGVLTDYPQGRLQIVAVPGTSDLRRGDGKVGNAVLLADQALPAGDFSGTLFYSHQRAEDILGKPWVEDIDQLQVDLNIALSKRWEVINRMIEAPIVAPGGAISEDMADLGGYNLLEVEPSLAGWRPRVMEWPSQVLVALDKEVEERRRAIYTGGGFQASSRGEAPGSRMAARAIMALQQADKTIHGPVNIRLKRSACDFAVRCWKQMKTYGDVPWLIRVTGDEYAHLVDPYVDSTKLSDDPPHFKLVNAFGPSPELRAQEIIELLQVRGADGEPLITTEDARRMYPNPLVTGDDSHPKAVQKRRARAITAAIVHLTTGFREKTGLAETNIAHPWVQKAALQVFARVEQQFPRLRDDDLKAHLDALSELTQDETADAIARLAAQQRQSLYFAWQAMMAGQMPVGAPAGAGPAGPGRPNSLNPRAVAAEMGGRGGAPAAVLG